MASISELALKQAAETVTKEAAEAAAKESAEAVTKAATVRETVESTVSKTISTEVKEAEETSIRIASDAATEGAEAVAKKEAAEAAAKESAESSIAKLSSEELDELGKSKGILEWMSKNRGTTLLAAGVAVFGAAVFAIGLEWYIENNNKKLSIVSITNPDVPNMDINNPDINNPASVIITFSPSTKISEGDKITINTLVFGNTTDQNMIHENTTLESIIGNKIDIKKIISNTEIKVIMPNISILATDGTMTLTTNFDNCLEQATKDTSENVTKTTGNLISDFFSMIAKFLGPALYWIIGFFSFILIFFVLMFIIKIAQKFKRK